MDELYIRARKVTSQIGNPSFLTLSLTQLLPEYGLLGLAGVGLENTAGKYWRVLKNVT